MLLPLLLAAALAFAFWYRRRRAGLDAVQAFRALKEMLRRAGLEVSPATAPGEVERQAAERFPAAQEPTGRLLRFYLEESFGGRRLSTDQRQELAGYLREVRRSLRRPQEEKGPEKSPEQKPRARRAS